MPDARQPVQRASDTAEYARIIEADFAKARAHLAALDLAVAAQSREIANLQHQLFAKDQELTALRKWRADILAASIARNLHPIEHSPESTDEEASA